jgi:hypothetical protein
VLTPEHFAEHVLYGVFFLVAAVAQLLLAALLVLRPGVWVFRVGVLSSLGLIATWLTTRALAPPFSTGPEPVTFAGVTASSVELAALVLLAVGLPVGADRLAGRPRIAWRWALLAGPAFVLLFLFATGALARLPTDLSEAFAVPSLSVDADGGWTFQSPRLTAVLTDHILLSVGWAVAVFVLVSGLLVALNAGVIVGLARCSAACRPQTGGVLAAAPAFVAAPACCGAGVPVGFALGSGTYAPLVSATPWLLLATTALLAGNLVLLRRRWRSACAPERG